MARIIALSGGIGSGKSTALEFCREYGCGVISADAIVHELYADRDSDLYKQIIARFGTDVAGSDGIDRGTLGEMVMSDATARADLERMVHPAVRLEMAARISALSQKFDIVVVEIPLLFESQLHTMFAEKWLIVADEASRVERASARDGVSADDIRLRVAAQMRDDEKRKLASHVLENNGDLEALRIQVFRLLQMT